MKVKVKNSRGEEQYVPAHWLEHKVLGKGFSLIGQVEKKAGPERSASVKKKEGMKDA